VFDICTKPTLDRTPLELKFLNAYMQSNFDVFNSIQSEQQLSRILSKLQPLQCQKGDYLIRQGSQADFLVILVEGTVSIQIRSRTIMQRKGPDLIGENALKSNETRSADVVADTAAKVLLLYRQSYMSALSDFEYELQETYSQAMRQSEVTKDWMSF
jgi:CRP-like cAMP-binding protein